MGFLDDTAIAISVSIMLFGLALALPYIEITFPIELMIEEDLPGLVVTILRLSIISLAVAVGSKPLTKEGNGFN